MISQNLDAKQQANIFNKMIQAYPAWIALINKSFLRDEFKDRYASIIRERMISINE